MSAFLRPPQPIQSLHGEDDSSPYGPEKRYRRPRIAIDRSSVTPSPALDLLLELGRTGYVELWSSEDEDLDAYLHIDLGGQDSNSIPYTISHSDGRTEFSGIWPPMQWLSHIQAHASATGARESRVASRFLAAAALMGSVDALVVGDLDFGASSKLVRRANPMTAESACALVGLTSRTRGEFHTPPISGSWFYFLAARAALPKAWRWYSACNAAFDPSGDNSIPNIGQSAIERLMRAIASRDKCLRHSFRDHAESEAEEAAFYFDAELLMLSSALDSVAQIAHFAHSVEVDQFSIGWRRHRWRRALRTAAPELWDATELGTPQRDAIELVALVRNTVHGEGMRKVQVQERGSATSQLSISRPIARDLEPIVDRHGGAELWGLEAAARPRLRPAAYAQQIIPLVADAMNTLMASTDVERLPEASQRDLMTGPPTDKFWFDPAITERILLLAGLWSGTRDDGRTPV